MPSEFEQLKSELLTRLEQSRTDPTAIARRAAARAGNPYPPDDVRYTPTIDEETARSRRPISTVKAFYAKFHGTSHAEIAVVGDFDADAVRPLLGRLFGDLRSATPYARVPQPFYPTKSSPQSFDTPDKANAAMFGRLSMPFNDQSPDYAPLLVANRVLGGDSEFAALPARTGARRTLVCGRHRAAACVESIRTARSSCTRSLRRRISTRFVQRRPKKQARVRYR